MPELPEVEIVRRGLEPAMVGSRIMRVEQRRSNLRFPLPELFDEKLQGKKISSLSRRSKYLIAEIENSDFLIMHLGMSGRFSIEYGEDKGVGGNFSMPSNANSRHDHVVFHLSNGARITYNDVRRFGFMLLIPAFEKETHAILRNIGIEPLSNAFNANTLALLLAKRRAPLKTALLNQQLIAGLGNIYVCEALHRSSLSPERPSNSIVTADEKPTPSLILLTRVIRDVLNEAIEAGGSTLRDYAHTDGSLGYFQHTFRVYGRENLPCLAENCTGTIKRIVQAGRSTFFCPSCQL